MRPNKRVRLVDLGSALPKASAKVYDFGVRQTESSRSDRIRVLEHENALLMRVLSETRTDIERLRELLTTP